MKKKSGLFFSNIFLIVFIILLIIGSVSYQREGPAVTDVQYIDTVKIQVQNQKEKEVRLPYTVKNLKHNTPVTVKAVIHPEKEDSIYIKTIYSPAKVYADDKLIFEFGKDEFYPDFMVDPATELHMIELYGDGSDVSIRVEFLSPKSRNSMSLQPMLVGGSKALIMERSRKLGTPLLFSIVQIFTGLSLIIVSLYIVFVDRKGYLFFWLGLFSLMTGIWYFSENNFSNILFRQNTLLYVLSFVGFFTCIIPLIHFTRMILDFKNPKPAYYMELCYTFFAGIALFLQLTGWVPCSTSMYFFHFVMPLALILLSGLTVREFIRYRTESARHFILPIGILTFCSLLEFFDYQPAFMTYIFSSFFQAGILIFLLIMGISAGLYIKDSIDLKNKEKELSFQQTCLDMQTDELKRTSVLLAKNEQILRQQRHDLRHHLVILQELGKDNEDLQEYLRTLIEQVPKSDVRFCENDIVNAVISHYSTLCRENHIDFQAKVIIPETDSPITDSNLCAILSNLLENAIEACQKLDEKERYIHLNSFVQYEMLSITMDNSFNGIAHKLDNTFFSTKRDDVGVGTASIRSIAEKLNGEAEFDFDDSVFHSSVFVNI